LYGLFAKSASGATVFGLNGEMCPYYWDYNLVLMLSNGSEPRDVNTDDISEDNICIWFYEKVWGKALDNLSLLSS
jgi:hypothetical protein